MGAKRRDECHVHNNSGQGKGRYKSTVRGSVHDEE